MCTDDWMIWYPYPSYVMILAWFHRMVLQYSISCSKLYTPD